MALDKALASVDANANEAWKKEAWKILKRLARKGTEFTTDDVWVALKKKELDTHEHRALGPLMVRLVREGYAVKDPYRITTSTRPERHQAILRIYKGVPAL